MLIESDGRSSSVVGTRRIRWDRRLGDRYSSDTALAGRGEVTAGGRVGGRVGDRAASLWIG